MDSEPKTEVMKMTHSVSIFDMLVFKSSNRVDWEKTNSNMIMWIRETMPGVTPSAGAMMSTDLMKQLKYKVKRAGVKKLYRSKHANLA